MRHSSARFSAVVVLVVASLIVGTGLTGLGVTEVSATAAEGRHIVVSRASTGVPADLAHRVSAAGGSVEAIHSSSAWP